MVQNALQTKELLHVIEAEVTTTPEEDKFTLALIILVRTLFDTNDTDHDVRPYF